MKVYLLRLVPIASLLLSCMRESDPGMVDATGRRVVTVRIVDAATSESIEGAEADWISAEKSLTDRDGLARLDGPADGRPVIQVRRQGYAEIEFALSEEAVPGDTPVSWVSTQELHRLGVAIRGSLELPKAGDSLARPAAGVGLELSLPGKFTTRVYQARTDDRGRYSFPELPEATSYTISAIPGGFPSGRLDLPARSLPSRAYLRGGEYEMPVLTMVPEGVIPYLEALSARDVHLAGTAPLRILFSQPVEVTSLPDGWLIVQSEKGMEDVSLAWSMENTLLSITPEAGDWESRSPCTFTLSGLSDIHGGRLEKPAVIRSTVLPSLPPVDSLWTGAPVDWSYPSYRLFWNRVAMAERYEIYQRKSPSEDFSPVGSVSGKDNTMRIAMDAPSGKVWMQHKVLPIAKGATSSLALAKILTVEDKVAPIFSHGLNPMVVGEGLDNTRGTTPITATFTLDLPFLPGYDRGPLEPLDTAFVPKVEIATNRSGCSDFLQDTSKVFWIEKADFHYTSTHSGAITAIIPPGKVSPGLVFWLDFTELRDLAGNRSGGDARALFIYYLSCP
jgi:hypothetical protein